MITLSDISLYRGTEQLLQATSLTIHPGHKVGLVGKNGCGKSSLFALLRGELSLDGGMMRLPNDWQIASVAQETPALECSAIDYVLDGDGELRALERALLEAEHRDEGQRIAELHGKLDVIGGYSAKARAATLLHGLGFSDTEISRPVSTFSGGWRMRLNLAQALMCRSDLMLLDEPTNHLDLDAVIWLSNYLTSYRGTLLLISHDRDFLDEIVSEIVHIENRTLNFYQGSYSDYERQRAEKLAQQQQLHEKQQRTISHMQKYVDRFRYKASKARQAQSRLKAIERMEMIAPAHVDSPFQFEFKPAPSLPNPLIKLDQVAAGYQKDAPILNPIKFSLIPGSRIGLLGRNGAGKSTLIKLLAGSLGPLEGKREISAGVQIGYFSQHQMETLRTDMGPLQQLALLAPGATEQQLRSYLGGFDFSGDKVFEPVVTFSGGEKARLVLALIIWQRPNLLLLDEPTNHLDLEMRQALTLALQEYEGALVLVSHDRHLLRSVADELYLVDAGQVTPFDGDLDDYYRWLMDGDKNDAEQTEPAPTGPSVDRKLRKRLEAEFRNKLSPMKKRLQQLETAMEQDQSQLDTIEQQLAESTLYEEQNKAKLQQALDQRTQLQKKLDRHEQEWLELEHTLDAEQQAFEAQFD